MNPQRTSFNIFHSARAMAVKIVSANRPMRIDLDFGEMTERLARRVVEKAKIAVNTGGRLGRIREDGQRASLPGEAPYTLSGELVASIRAEGSTIVVGAPHGRVHEEGVRPFIQPAIDEVLRKEGLTQ